MTLTGIVTWDRDGDRHRTGLRGVADRGDEALVVVVRRQVHCAAPGRSGADHVDVQVDLDVGPPRIRADALQAPPRARSLSPEGQASGYDEILGAHTLKAVTRRVPGPRVAGRRCSCRLVSRFPTRNYDSPVVIGVGRYVDRSDEGDDGEGGQGHGVNATVEHDSLLRGSAPGDSLLRSLI